jgi:hypothetical protein
LYACQSGTLYLNLAGFTEDDIIVFFSLVS